MNTIRLFALLGVLALPVALGAAAAPPKAPKPSVPNPLAPRFAQVRERIDALYQHRNAAPPPLDPRENPFRLQGPAPAAPGALVAAGRGVGPTAPVSLNALGMLQQAVATLKISGVFEIAGRSHLVINARPYKEGDVLQAQVQNEPVYLRVKEISKRSVTLVLNEAEMTLKY